MTFKALQLTWRRLSACGVGRPSAGRSGVITRPASGRGIMVHGARQLSAKTFDRRFENVRGVTKEARVLWRVRLTRMFLWVSVVAWGLLVGGKLFDLRVLVGAWSASPPESLTLLPYGPRFPVDTGEYFFPSSVALLVCSFGSLIAGWNTPSRFRALLAIPPVMLLVTLVFTVLWFWPANAALWAVARGAPSAIGDPVEVTELVRRWVTYDWLRVAVGLVGFVCCIRAIREPLINSSRDA